MAMTSDSSGELGGSATSKVRTQDSADGAAVLDVLALLKNDLSVRLRRGAQMFFSGKWRINYICSVLKVLRKYPTFFSVLCMRTRAKVAEGLSA